MNRTLLILALLAFSSCSERVSTSDAKDFTKVLEALGSTTDADTRARLMLQGCSEVSSCAAGCKRELSAAAGSEMDPSMRGTVLASCFKDLRKAHDEKGMTAEAWFAGYFRAYADRARAAVEPGDQKKFDEARAAAHL